MSELKIVDTGNELRLLGMDEASKLLGIQKHALRYDYEEGNSGGKDRAIEQV